MKYASDRFLTQMAKMCQNKAKAYIFIGKLFKVYPKSISD